MNLNKHFLQIILFLLMASMFRFQLGTTMYVYMPVVILIWIVSLKYIKFSDLYFYEILFVVSYMYIIFSSLWSLDILLSLKIVLGEMILLATYFLLRYLVDTLTLEEFEKMFIKLAQYFTVISLALYLFGMGYFYILNIAPLKTMYLNDSSIGIFGLYLEGYLPRLRGLAESPNIYMYSEFIIAMFFIYKKMTKWSVLAISTILLSWSATGLLVLVVVMILNNLNNRSFLKVFGVFLLAVIVVVILYFTNDTVNRLIYVRYVRIATGSGRFELWDYLLSFLNNNVVFGYGANSTRVLLESIRGYQSAHNSLIDIFITTGIFGLFIEISLFVVSLWMSYKLKLIYKTNMFFNIWVLYFITSMFNNLLHVAFTIFYLFFLYVYYSKIQDQVKGGIYYAK